MDRLRVLRTISANAPFLSLAQALLLADALHAEFYKPRPSRASRPLYDLNTHEGLVAFARTRPEVMGWMPDSKIRAIKALREVAQTIDPARYGNNLLPTYIGLREAKDAIDTIAAGL